MSSIKSLIRKLKLLPNNLNTTNPLFIEFLDCYHGKDYLKLCNKIEKENIEQGGNIDRYLLCDNSEIYNINWSLSISIIKPNNKIHSLDPSHLKLLEGNINCDSDSLKFKLIKGSISIPKIHNIENKTDKDAIFLSIHNNILFNIPLL
jgi:hypothetical protein